MFERRLGKNRKFNSAVKSTTAVTLPTIHKASNSPSSDKNYRSGYLDTVSLLEPDVDYGLKDTAFVQQQQSTLKSILKKINCDTVVLVDRLRPKNNHRLMPNQEVTASVLEKEVSNSRKVLTTLKAEIQHLREKYRGIVEQHHGDQIMVQIGSVKQEIEELRAQIAADKLQISREGKAIEKHLAEGKDPRLFQSQAEQQLVSLRIDKLKAEHSRINTENAQLQNKLIELDPLIKQLDEQLQPIKEQSAENAAGRERDLALTQKNKQLESLRKKAEFAKKTQQSHYYKVLKDLEGQTAICAMIDAKTTQLETRTAEAKAQAQLLETQFRQIKNHRLLQGERALDYLQAQRELKDQQHPNINQQAQSLIKNEPNHSTKPEEQPGIERTPQSRKETSGKSVRDKESQANPRQEEEGKEREREEEGKGKSLEVGLKESEGVGGPPDSRSKEEEQQEENALSQEQQISERSG